MPDFARPLISPWPLSEIHAVAAIPYTLTGKKMEIPVRRILAGTPPEKAASREAMMQPEALDWYVAFAADRVVAT